MTRLKRKDAVNGGESKKGRMSLKYIAAIAISAILIGWYVFIQMPANGTVLATIDSLPSGATVFIQDQNDPGKIPTEAGTTPVKVNLEKRKRYRILMVFTLDKYREKTRDIPEIQERLDKFREDERTGSLNAFSKYFFDIYSKKAQILTSEGNPGELQGIGIPSYIYVDAPFKDKMRIASMFVPLGMDPDVLLPLADKDKHYDISKEELASIMRQNNFPDVFLDKAHNSLTKTGMALVTLGELYPGGRIQKRFFFITTPDMGDDSKLYSTTIYNMDVK